MNSSDYSQDELNKSLADLKRKLAIMQDLYENEKVLRKMSQEARKECEEKYRILFSESPYAILMIRDGIFVECNNTAAKMLRGTSNQIIGKTPAELSPLLQPDGKKSDEKLNIYLNCAIQDGGCSFEWVHRRFDGEYFLADVTITATTIGGKPSQLVTWSDVTHRKISEEAMLEQNKQMGMLYEIIENNLNEKNQLIEELSAIQEKLELSNLEKDKFFSILAHDLKNPLGSFREISNMLVNDYDVFTEDERKEFLQIIKKSSTQVFSLLENLLEWSRSQRGLIEFNPITVDLSYIANTCIELLSLAATKKKIDIINNIPSNTNVFVDLNIVTTVVRNLISNAIKFTPENGRIEVGSDAKIEKGYITAFVRDNGVGMTKETMDKLFKIDQNVTMPGTSGEKGTGLGLILCKEFIEKHTGTIWVESEEGNGTTFFFTLPVI